MSAVKKSFEKPGQTMEHDESTPDGPALKIFYETLLQQRPESAMAAEWLLKRGLLEDDLAKSWLKKLGKDKKTTGATKPAPKRKASADDFESKPKAKGRGKAMTKKGAAAKGAAAKKPGRKKAKPERDSSDEEPFEEKPKPATRKPPAKRAAAAPDSSDEDETPLSQRKK
mmetsp:Transcript_20209/g.61523  ORF Transcript_20209/g.61523 Transcript_20209/m.61523 type:complete len:170 (+) Transcript_20209:121-630(+)